MRTLVSFICIVLAGLLTAFRPNTVLAGTFGKVQGIVADDLGNPLPGANILVEGTQRGATADAEGYYVILGVYPGRHRITASMVGYTTSTLEDVSVKADFTTTLDFTVTEAALEAAEMVVTAKRPPVEPDKTTSRYVVDIFEIENVPLIRNTQDLVSLQPGVSQDGFLRIRGADKAESQHIQQMYYEVDGVKLINDDGFVNYSQWTPLNKGALQEVSVLVGGMDAEYGNAAGGVISLVTREAGSAFGGQIEYRLTPPGKHHWGPNIYESSEFAKFVGLTDPWSDQAFVNETDPETGRKVHTRADYTDVIGHWVEGSLSGPLSDNAGFFVNARHSREAPEYPNQYNREPDNFQSMGSVTYRAGDDMKFKLGGIYSIRDEQNGFSRSLGFRLGDWLWSRWWWPRMEALFLPEGFSTRGTMRHDEKVAYLTATHSLSPKTFYDVRVSWQQTLIDLNGSVPEGQSTTQRRDDFGFLLPWNEHTVIDHQKRRWTLQADLTSQLARSILGKVGIELMRYDLQILQYSETTRPRRRVHLTAKGDQFIGLEPFHPQQVGAYAQTKMEFEGLVINTGVRFDGLHPGDTYIQDAYQWWHYWRLTRFRNVPLRSTDWITSVSPRLGVSHPVTERSTIRFYTGVLHEMPDKQQFYNREYRTDKQDEDLNGSGQIDPLEKGNALELFRNGMVFTTAVKPQRTVAFEAGVDWNFAGDFVLSSTAYHKDGKGYIANRTHTVHPDKNLWPEGIAPTNVFRANNNNNVKTSRGFEISFKKLFSQMTSFNLSYNISWTEIGSTNEKHILVHDASYVDSDQFFLGVTVDADGQEHPRVPTAEERAEYRQKAEAGLTAFLARGGTVTGADVILNVESSKLSPPGQFVQSFWQPRLPAPYRGVDRRNEGAAQFLFSAPADYGIKALAGFRATMVYRVQTGTPWQYTPPSGPPQRRNQPLQTQTDVNFEKDFRFGKSGVATGFIEVRNLWNQKDELFQSSNYVLYALSLPEPGDANFEKYGDYKDLTRYRHGQRTTDGHSDSHGGFGGRPRMVVLGARVSF